MTQAQIDNIRSGKGGESDYQAVAMAATQLAQFGGETNVGGANVRFSTDTDGNIGHYNQDDSQTFTTGKTFRANMLETGIAEVAGTKPGASNTEVMAIGAGSAAVETVASVVTGGVTKTLGSAVANRVEHALGKRGVPVHKYDNKGLNRGGEVDADKEL